jgi:uncharacterized membrane protein
MPRALWACVTFLSTLVVVVAVRRILYLSSPAMGLDGGFAVHALLTLSHVVSGIVFILLGPFQFMAGLRRRRPTLHRWIGRAFLVDSVFVGVTALVMGPLMAIGGVLETAATLFFGLLFLFALVRGFIAIRGRRVAEHRRWMIRAYAIGLGVATVRPIVGVFFATSRITHLTPPDFFGIAFWLGFTLSIAAGELWIRTQPAGAAQFRVGKRRVNPTL